MIGASRERELNKVNKSNQPSPSWTLHTNLSEESNQEKIIFHHAVIIQLHKRMECLIREIFYLHEELNYIIIKLSRVSVLSEQLPKWTIIMWIIIQDVSLTTYSCIQAESHRSMYSRYCVVDGNSTKLHFAGAEIKVFRLPKKCFTSFSHGM